MTIVLKEYQSIERDDEFLSISESKELLKYLTTLNLADALSIGVNNITATQYVGVVCFNNKRIEVLPKLLGSKGSRALDSSLEEREQMMSSLLYMLSYTHRLKINPTGILSFNFKNENLLEVFVYLFALELNKGLNREFPFSYEKKNENLGYVRGKIKFKEDLKHNSFNRSKIYCEFSNFQRDNIFNQTFLYICNRLYLLSKSIETKRLLKQNIKLLEGVTNKKIEYNMIASKDIGKSYNYLKHSLNFCKMFLKNSAPTLSSGGHDNFCILFDMNEVFEEFIHEFITRNKEEISPEIKDIEFQRNRKLFSGWEDLNSGISAVEDRRNIKNDIRVVLKDNSSIILDTKYKLINSPFEISTSDSFQMFMYSHIENVDEDARPRILLLYPQYQNKISFRLPFKGSDASLEVHTLPLELDNNERRQVFLKELRNILLKSQVT
ncbi:McrC family protein [Bacteriovoracaceae bacterium]|nr:McrC family protein [Bacteriovoracaceae bacterium]